MRKSTKDIKLYSSVLFLGVFAIIGLFSPFFANDNPIFTKDDAGFHFTLFEKNQITGYTYALYPLIRYDHTNIDEANSNFVSPSGPQKLRPGQQVHLLGTDQVGRDIAAGMIHGSRIALLTGSFSMAIALIIGLLIGLTGAYYGNSGLRVQRKVIYLLFIAFFSVSYFAGYADFLLSNRIASGLFLLSVVVLILFLEIVLRKLPHFKAKITIPLDLLFSNFMEIFQSLPGSFLILILVSLFTKASVYNVILIIGFLRWPMIARYVRAEMLKIKEQRYIEASRAIGMKDIRIILKHAMPATLTPVIVAVAFGFSSAILLESALSFLGIGLPADHVSFGSMLNEARKNYEAWWLAVFPGLAIFSLVFLLNYVGDKLSKKIERK